MAKRTASLNSLPSKNATAQGAVKTISCARRVDCLCRKAFDHYVLKPLFEEAGAVFSERHDHAIRIAFQFKFPIRAEQLFPFGSFRRQKIRLFHRLREPASWRWIQNSWYCRVVRQAAVVYSMLPAIGSSNCRMTIELFSITFLLRIDVRFRQFMVGTWDAYDAVVAF